MLCPKPLFSVGFRAEQKIAPPLTNFEQTWSTFYQLTFRFATKSSSGTIKERRYGRIVCYVQFEALMEGFVGQERVVVLVAFCLLIRQISSFRRELTETSRPRHFRDTFAERAHSRRLFGETTRQAGTVAPSILDGACMFSPSWTVGSGSFAPEAAPYRSLSCTGLPARRNTQTWKLRSEGRLGVKRQVIGRKHILCHSFEGRQK